MRTHRLVSVFALIAGAASAQVAAPTPPAPPVEVTWPAAKPKGVVVFLHGLSSDPLVEEADGIEMLTTMASRRGFITVVPVAPRRCRQGKAHCWSLDDVAEELASVDAAVDAVARNGGAGFRRHIVGFSNGGFLLGAALERQLLDDFDQVGIVAGGPVGAQAKTPLDVPTVYLEVGRADRYQRSATVALRDRLRARTPEGVVHFREVKGGHEFSAERAQSFLRWFWAASPAKTESTPPSTTSAP